MVDEVRVTRPGVANPSRRLRGLWPLLTLGALTLGALALAGCGQASSADGAGAAPAPERPAGEPTPRTDAPDEAPAAESLASDEDGPAADGGPSEGAEPTDAPAADDDAPSDGGLPPETAPTAAAPSGEYGCRIPALAVARSPACADGAGYPECKWALPDTDGSGGTYTRWRNTIDEHTWGRPALVGVILATARAFHARYPDTELLVGDLDAPGPRHQTHKTGVDVDLYLRHTLMVENLGGRQYRMNYRRRTREEVQEAREKVETLARILATCSGGQLRIYYNDTIVRDRFHEWFDGLGYETPFGRPMQRHNALHDFHFHVTIAEDVPVPPWAAPHEGEHPVRDIPTPPDIEGVTVFAQDDDDDEAGADD